MGNKLDLDNKRKVNFLDGKSKADKNKALFFDINFKSNTLLLSNKHTTFGYSFAQLIKTRLDFFFIKSNYINNNNTYRNSFNGVFKFKNNLSFSTYLALVYTQNKKCILV